RSPAGSDEPDELRPVVRPARISEGPPHRVAVLPPAARVVELEASRRNGRVGIAGVDRAPREDMTHGSVLAHVRDERLAFRVHTQRRVPYVAVAHGLARGRGPGGETTADHRQGGGKRPPPPPGPRARGTGG